MIDDRYLAPTPFLDSDHPRVAAWARAACAQATDPTGQAVRLFRAVRDGIRYTVRVDFTDPDAYRASSTLARGDGFCVPKSVLLAAAARAVGIPARLHFADLRNRLVPDDLRALMGTDLFVYHGYVELHLGGRWRKATPSFDQDTCERQGIVPVDFDGRRDALLHPTDAGGRPQFEYVADLGTRDDLPFDAILRRLAEVYPRYDRDSWATAFGEEASDG